MSFKFRFGELVHVLGDGVDRHAQKFDVLFATGADAGTGGDGQLIASGTTGITVDGE